MSSRRFLPRVLLFGGLAATCVLFVLLLMDTTLLDNWWLRAAVIGSTFIWATGFLLGAAPGSLVRNVGLRDRNQKRASSSG